MMDYSNIGTRNRSWVTENSMQRFARNNSFYASTFFKAAMYHPDESQLLTTGTDRKITWWDAYDCQPIRILDGSLTSEVYSIDISPDGAGMVSAGVDREVKLWNYDEGHNYFVGLGHSEPITKASTSLTRCKRYFLLCLWSLSFFTYLSA
ncbi:hypothetical protein Mapa_011293 [Marchantia paleacea]|nr:hypothetical protein Mapa_011293 [Marchantia paleacea]